MTTAHWIDAIDDTDIELLGMSDDEMEAFAYAHAEPLGPALALTPRATVTERLRTALPHAA